MLGNNKVRLVISVDKDELQEVKRRISGINTTISEHLMKNTIKSYRFSLRDWITLKIDYIGEVQIGSECWRINIEFLEANTEKWLRDIWYEVWVSQEYVEDYFKMDRSPTDRDYADFAFRFIEKRYKECKNNLPKEFGVFITKETGKILVNGRNDLLPLFKKVSKS